MYIPVNIVEQFGRNVKAERSRIGLSQEDLAEKMGVNSQYISRIECGRANMSLKKIVELTNFLGVDIKDILRF